MRKTSAIALLVILSGVTFSHRAEAVSRLRCALLVTVASALTGGGVLTYERGQSWKDQYVAWQDAKRERERLEAEARAAEAKAADELREKQAKEAQLQAQLALAEAKRLEAAEKVKAAELARLELRNRVAPFVNPSGRPYPGLRTAVMPYGDSILFALNGDEWVVWNSKENEYRSIKIGNRNTDNAPRAVMTVEQKAFGLYQEGKVYWLRAIPWELTAGKADANWQRLGDTGTYFIYQNQLYVFDEGSIMRVHFTVPLQYSGLTRLESLGITGVKALDYSGTWEVTLDTGEKKPLSALIK